MALQDIYRSYLRNKFISSKAEDGVYLTVDEVEEYLRENIDDLDLTVPQFDSDDYIVSGKENASASKFNNTMEAMKQDLTVLYKVFLSLGRAATDDYERWRHEAKILEKRLIDLEDKIDSLLLLSQDTEGYHSYFLDNLTDLLYVDLDNTTVAVDIESNVAFIPPTFSGDQETSKITTFYDTNGDPLSEDQLDDLISFKVRTNPFLGLSSEGNRGDMLNQSEGIGWKNTVKMPSKDKSVTCELLVKLSDTPIPISSIYMKLLASSGMSITPLYSIDNYNFAELPTEGKTLDLNLNTQYQATFNFETIQVKWIKFLLIKSGFDRERNGYMYEFGFDEIAFYEEAFTPNETHSFISKPLYILDKDGNIREFSKVALEVCESEPDFTSIRYFITPGGSSSFSIDANTKWYPISPSNRKTPDFPLILNLGDITEVEVEDVSISYDGTTTDEDFRNPAETFNLLSLNTDDSILDESITASSIRFVPTRTDEYILDYQIKDSDYSGSGSGNSLTINEDNIQIFRNVGEVGSTETVRGVGKGWRFENPYYITLIEVLSSELAIDFGDGSVIIDGKVKSGSQKIIGKSPTFDGVHEIRVHKDNWIQITSELNTLSELVAADPLYPYNHKLLIEGYKYGNSWLNTQDQVYQGADLFFARRLKKVSTFDLSYNLTEDNKYLFFALDRDISNTHAGNNSSTRVFVVKVDKSNSDFVNEKFILRFNLINQRYSYLRFRADLSTKVSTNCPVMGAYKLKFGD
jgi:hypothetical protein